MRVWEVLWPNICYRDPLRINGHIPISVVLRYSGGCRLSSGECLRATATHVLTLSFAMSLSRCRTWRRVSVVLCKLLIWVVCMRMVPYGCSTSDLTLCMAACRDSTDRFMPCNADYT